MCTMCLSPCRDREGRGQLNVASCDFCYTGVVLSDLGAPRFELRS